MYDYLQRSSFLLKKSYLHVQGVLQFEDLA